MKIQPVSQQQNSCSFQAMIAKTAEMRHFCDRLGTGTQYKNQNKIWLCIERALKEYPLPTVLFTQCHRLYGVSRASIEAYDGRFLDDKYTKDNVLSIMSVWKNFLNPQNKESFNKVMGKDNKNFYQPWWNAYIQPIWKDIQKFF